MAQSHPSAGIIRIRFCGSRTAVLLSAWQAGSPFNCLYVSIPYLTTRGWSASIWGCAHPSDGRSV